MALKSSVKTYRLDTGQLPPPEMGLEALITRPPFLPKDARWSKIMDAPLKDPWGNPYRYVAGDGVPEGFGFYSCGPDGVSSSLGHDPDDRNSWEDPDGRDKPPLPDHWKPWLSLGGGALAIVSFLLGRRSGAAGLRRLQRVA